VPAEELAIGSAFSRKRLHDRDHLCGRARESADRRSYAAHPPVHRALAPLAFFDPPSPSFRVFRGRSFLALHAESRGRAVGQLFWRSQVVFWPCEWWYSLQASQSPCRGQPGYVQGQSSLIFFSATTHLQSGKRSTFRADIIPPYRHMGGSGWGTHPRALVTPSLPLRPFGGAQGRPETLEGRQAQSLEQRRKAPPSGGGVVREGMSGTASNVCHPS
jgi:hypothetical protein